VISTRVPGRLARVTLACAAAALFALPAAASAAPRITVANTGSDVAGCGTGGANPDCQTINFALTQVDPNGEVSVAPGLYVENVLVPSSKPGVTLHGAQRGIDGADRPLVPSSGTESIVVPPLATHGSPFKVEADDTTIDGFAIQDGQTSTLGQDGAGVQMTDDPSGVEIAYSIIRNNQIGIYLKSKDGPTRIVHNAFTENNTPTGGSASGNGIYTDVGANGATIAWNTFRNHDNSSMVITQSFTTTPNRNLVLTHNVSQNDRPDASGFFIVGLRGWDNEIADNQVVSNGSSLFIGDSKHVNISGNDLEADGNGYSAVRIAGPGDGFPLNTSEDMRITGNYLHAADDGNGIKVVNDSFSDQLVVRYNRIAGNGAFGILNQDLANAVDAVDNFWGCNEGPDAGACDDTSGPVFADPWLVLTATAHPTDVVAPGAADIDVDFTHDSDGDPVAGADVLPAPDVSFDKLSGPGTLTDTLVPSLHAQASTTIESNDPGTSVVEATGDDATDSASVTFKPQPAPQTVTQTNTVIQQVPAAEQQVAGDREVRPTFRFRIGLFGLTRAHKFCAAGNFIARVSVRTSPTIKKVDVLLDGRRIAKAKKNAFRFRVPAKGLDAGVHHIRVEVSFADGTDRGKTFRFRRCR
jgi:nitrous oxidase accessory protein NosD